MPLSASAAQPVHRAHGEHTADQYIRSQFIYAVDSFVISFLSFGVFIFYFHLPSSALECFVSFQINHAARINSNARMVDAF